MFYNLKIAFRNHRHNGLYSVIKIVGLAVSLTAVILIKLWVWDELNFDKPGKRSENSFLLAMDVKNNVNNQYWIQTSIPMLQAAKEYIPEVEEACVVDIKYNMAYIAYDGNVFSAGLLLVRKNIAELCLSITIGWWMFALAGVITLLLTLITVGWQAIKAATANPVKAIKTE